MHGLANFKPGILLHLLIIFHVEHLLV